MEPGKVAREGLEVLKGGDEGTQGATGAARDPSEGIASPQAGREPNEAPGNAANVTPAPSMQGKGTGAAEVVGETAQITAAPATQQQPQPQQEVLTFNQKLKRSQEELARQVNRFSAEELQFLEKK